MRFEWDEAKSEATFQQRGFDFAYAAQVFADPCRIERLDTRQDYGEPRWQTFGAVDDVVIFVVFTLRGSAIRIISARRAHDNEKRAYHDNRG